MISVTVRSPSMNGSTFLCTWVSSTSSPASSGCLSSWKTTSKDGIFFSTWLHSSTRRAPSIRSASGGMLTRFRRSSSGICSESKWNEPWVHAKR